MNKKLNRLLLYKSDFFVADKELYINLSLQSPFIRKEEIKHRFRRNISFASQYNERRGKVKWNTDLNLKKYTLSAIYKVYIIQKIGSQVYVLCEQT